MFARLTNNREHGRQASEAYQVKSVSDLGCMHVLLNARTSNWQLWTASDELQELPSLAFIELAHCLQQILDAVAVHVVAMIGLDGVRQGCDLLAYAFANAKTQQTKPKLTL